MDRNGPRVAFNQVTQQFTIRDGAGKVNHFSVEEMGGVVGEISTLIPKNEPSAVVPPLKHLEAAFAPQLF